jgi:hypothetical protein
MKTRVRQQRQEGSAVIVVLALVFLALAYVAFNHRTLQSLDREVKLIEKRQIQRLQALASTNSWPATNAALPAPAGISPAVPLERP